MAEMRSRQQGAILVMTAFFVIILIGIAAFALDLGRLYVLRTEMQNAVDSAALAAAVELDGKEDARSRAVNAATNLLIHQGRFAKNPELISQLTYDETAPENSPFVFYSWIGAEPDPTKWPDGCDPNNTIDPGKCITTDDKMAQYVKIKLDPSLYGANDDGYYGVDFFFIPILGLFTGSPILEGYTKVMAVAGNTDSSICNLPPLMICEPPGGFDKYLSRGQEVLLKTQGAGATWLPGDFAFLEPVQCLEGEVDCTAIAQLNKALASQLAQERQLGCTPPVVTPLPGDRQATAYAVNTRVGLYGSYGGVDYVDSGDDGFPAATDIVDYPRDASFDASGRFGSGVWDIGSYFSNYHPGDTIPYDPSTDTDPDNGQTVMSRFQTYYWELYGVPGTGSHEDWKEIYHNLWEQNEVTDLDGNTPPPNWPERSEDIANGIAQCRQRPVGDAWDHPSNKDCLNLVGDPRKQPPVSVGGSGVAWDKPNRRVWFVAALNCADYENDINNRKPFTVTFGEGGNGEFIKFFLTEHIKKGPPTEILAEYLGPAVGEEEENILIHNIVQLYE